MANLRNEIKLMWLIFFSYHAKSPENSGKEKKKKSLFVLVSILQALSNVFKSTGPHTSPRYCGNPYKLILNEIQW